MLASPLLYPWATPCLEEEHRVASSLGSMSEATSGRLRDASRRTSVQCSMPKEKTFLGSAIGRMAEHVPPAVPLKGEPLEGFPPLGHALLSSTIGLLRRGCYGGVLMWVPDRKAPTADGVGDRK